MGNSDGRSDSDGRSEGLAPHCAASAQVLAKDLVAPRPHWQSQAGVTLGHISICVAGHRGDELSPEMSLDHVSKAGGLGHTLPHP